MGPKVRVNTVTVGVARTEDNAHHYGDESSLAAVAATVPLGRPSAHELASLRFVALRADDIAALGSVAAELAHADTMFTRRGRVHRGVHRLAGPLSDNERKARGIASGTMA